MNKTLILLTLVCGLLPSANSLFAQHEREPVEAYRVTTAFHTPMVVVAGTEGKMEGINVDPLPDPGRDSLPMVSPDRFGVHYFAPEALWKLILVHVGQNSLHESAEGYRIQIYAGSSLESANDAKADFLESFNDEQLEVYQMWNPPHFRVRVGDFLSRNLAMREVATIRQIFPDAFIVSDKVKLPKYKDRSKVVSPDGLKEESSNAFPPEND